MIENINPESISIVVGALALLVGVRDARKTHKQSLRQHYLQIILSISDTFRVKWESGWADILEELNAKHVDEGLNELPKKYEKNIRYMLNWVDWLGAMKACGALNDLTILTSSIGIPIKKIINAGKPLIVSDVKQYGPEYWQNLFIIASHLKIQWTQEISEHTMSNQVKAGI